MSLRQSGMPSSFLRCLILLPVYTDETLAALRLLFEPAPCACEGDAPPVLAAPSAVGVHVACSSDCSFGRLLVVNGGIGAALVCDGGFGCSDGAEDGSPGSAARMCCKELIAGATRSNEGQAFRGKRQRDEFHPIYRTSMSSSIDGGSIKHYQLGGYREDSCR